MPQSDPAGSGALSGINLDRAARVNHAAGATDDHAIALAWAADRLTTMPSMQAATAVGIAPVPG